MQKHFSIYPPVFFPTAIFSILFVAGIIIIGEPAQLLFADFQALMSENLDWLLKLCINYYLFFVLYLGLSKYGKIRFGGSNSSPEFSTFSWVAMLFSAGMGVGLLYFSIAEPMFHFLNPGRSTLPEAENISRAMTITLFHYGFHVWAVYCLVGLALAYFCFNRNKPLSISSTLEPLLPSQLGFLKSWIDATATLATLFGLATSLGFGAKQFSAGLESVFGIPNTSTTQMVAIVVITMIATVSILTGLKRGIRFLSEVNLKVAVVLLAIVLILGPTVSMLKFTSQSASSYLINLLEVSFYKGVFGGENAFFDNWTLFYWAWWISWSPFVGTFIARVSRGRTIREFVFFVLLTPTVLTMIWMGIFAGLAFDMQVSGALDVAQIVKEDSSKALFSVFDLLPFTQTISVVAIFLVGTFFITSSDSGSLVVDYMTSGGKLDTPATQKVFWASMEGLIAIALIAGGGLSALQAASISTGFPFALVLVLITFSLLRTLDDKN